MCNETIFWKIDRLWLLKWCKIQSILLYVFSLILFIFSHLFCIQFFYLILFSLILFIFSELIYIQSHRICIQSDLIYVRSTYIYSVSSYMYSVWSYIYSVQSFFKCIFSHMFTRECIEFTLILCKKVHVLCVTWRIWLKSVLFWKNMNHVIQNHFLKK